MKRFLIKGVKFYQKNLSALSHGSCRFRPTCSHYAIEALNTYGAFRGTLLTVYRILRCSPLCKGGYDPVPPKAPKRIMYGKKS